jgi:hypothetical protein
MRDEQAAQKTLSLRLGIPQQPVRDDRLHHDGACIQPDRHGASVIRVHGRCEDAWEELRREGWLAKATNGSFVLSERGQTAISNLESRR